jgi:hypothetical protein
MGRERDATKSRPAPATRIRPGTHRDWNTHTAFLRSHLFAIHKPARSCVFAYDRPRIRKGWGGWWPLPRIRRARRVLRGDYLRARWSPASAAPGQDVPESEGDHDHSRRDGDYGDCRGGQDHAALISPRSAGETLGRSRSILWERRLLPSPRSSEGLFVNSGRVFAAKPHRPLSQCGRDSCRARAWLVHVRRQPDVS